MPTREAELVARMGLRDAEAADEVAVGADAAGAGTGGDRAVVRLARAGAQLAELVAVT